MRSFWRKTLWCSFALVLPILAGCNKTGATVTGNVTVDGAPLPTGGITFTPVGGTGNPVGGTIKDGKYTAENIPKGKMKVTVTGSMGGSSGADINSYKPPTFVILPITKGNGVEVEMTGSTQTVDVPLTTK